MRPITPALAAALALIPLAGAAPAQAAPGQVRFVHGVSDLAAPMDVFVDGRKVARVARGAVSPYVRLAAPKAHTYQFKVRGSVRYTGSFVLKSQKALSVVASGITWKVNDQTRVVKDRSLRPIGVAEVRLAHRSPDAPTMALWAQADGAAKPVRIVASAGYPMDEEARLLPGTYTFFVRRPGSSTNLLTVPNVKLGAADLSTIWLLGSWGKRAGELRLKATRTKDALPAAWDQSWLRVVNATPDRGKLKVCVRGKAFATLTPGSARTISGGYVVTTPGKAAVRVVRGTQPCAAAPIVSSTVTLPHLGGTTLIVSGDAAGVQPRAITAVVDDVVVPGAGKTRVRVFHYVVGANAVQPQIGSGGLLPAIAYGEATADTVVATGAKLLTVNEDGGSPVIAALSGKSMPLKAKTATTVILVGKVGATADELPLRPLVLRSLLG